MIFVTVGGQMPFDRLVSVVDDWAGCTGRDDVFAQIGPTELRPRNVEFEQFLVPADFRRRMESASLIIAHAGMGSILSALEIGKPILVMPRLAKFRETRNDHQVATAERFRSQGLVAVASDERELRERLETIEELSSGGVIGRSASSRLIDTIRDFVAGI